MSPPVPCPECIRLWQELNDATSADFELRQQRNALGPADAAQLRAVEREVNAAAAHHEAARNAFCRHLTTNHIVRSKAATA
jgi:hypothetical protein